MPRNAQDDCMFCDVEPCDTHAPKKKAPRKLVEVRVPNEPGRVEPTRSRAADALNAQANLDADRDRIEADALRALSPLLSEGDLIKYRNQIGPTADMQLRVRRWRHG